LKTNINEKSQNIDYELSWFASCFFCIAADPRVSEIPTGKYFNPSR